MRFHSFSFLIVKLEVLRFFAKFKGWKEFNLILDRLWWMLAIKWDSRINLPVKLICFNKANYFIINVIVN